MRKLRSPGHAGQQRGWGRFQIESAIMALMLLIPIFFSLAVPVVTQPRLYSRERAAIQSIKTIHTAEVQYQSQYGRYAASLVELGPPASGAPNAFAADLIPKDLAGGEAARYTFIVSAVPGGYVIRALPASYGISGRRSFYSDQTMVIRENDGPEPATPQSKELR
jgi:type IV pilus assembly protein PilA